MRKLLITLLTVAAFLPLKGQNRPEDVQQFTLKNGMRFLVLEDHSIPNANMYLFWRVGSRNERPGITGLSHFFEHMMFNGAKKYGPKQFDRVMEAAGGSNNAYTSSDITVYTDWFPSSALETMFDLESDRIGHLDFDDKMIESERGVVLSERSTGLENSNFNLLYNYVQSCAYYAHPYRWPVIGYESDIKAWKKEDLQAYFRTYYAPNNCVVVVSGDVTLAEVQRLAKQYMEPIPAQEPPEDVRTIEPPQDGERRVEVHKEVSSENLLMVWHGPEPGSKDHAAMELLAYILAGGNSSRLTANLIYEQETAFYVGCWQDLGFDPGLFSIYGVAGMNVKGEELEQAIWDHIDAVKRKGVSEEEIRKARNNKLMEFYTDMETIDGKSNALGTYELFHGDFRKMFQVPEVYGAITPDDVRRVANQYLSRDQVTVGILRPKGGAK